MYSSTSNEERGGQKNPLLSGQATSAELIASIRFSTRPEDVLYLHLKDSKAHHTPLTTHHTPLATALDHRCGTVSTQIAPRVLHLEFPTPPTPRPRTAVGAHSHQHLPPLPLLTTSTRLFPVRERLAAFYARACPQKLLKTYDGNLTALDRILQSYIELGCSAIAVDKLNAELRLKYGAHALEPALVALACGCPAVEFINSILTTCVCFTGCDLDIAADLVRPNSLPVSPPSRLATAHTPILSPSLDHAPSNAPPRAQLHSNGAPHLDGAKAAWTPREQLSNSGHTPFASSETLSSMKRQQQQQQRSPRRNSATVLQIRSVAHDERGGNPSKFLSMQQSMAGASVRLWCADSDGSQPLNAHHPPPQKHATTGMAWIGNRKMTVKVCSPLSNPSRPL